MDYYRAIYFDPKPVRGVSGQVKHDLESTNANTT